MLPPGFDFRKPWYARATLYVPVIVVALLIGSLAVYMSILAAGLKAEAARYDLAQLQQMESASVILDRNNKIFGQIYVENRETIPYEQIPRDLVSAVVAVEDTKFYQHHGYDAFGIVRAALKNFSAGHVRQGASTVTQQLARNSFALKDRTFRRKLLEIFLARRIEDNFNKQKIMELYLNRIYFGSGFYGAEAAARGYFAKHASELSLAECATLAGLIKSPNRLSPWSDKAGSREARNVALGRMRDLGVIDRQKCANAQAEDLVINSRQNAQGQTYAVDYIRQKVIEVVGWDRAMNEGFRIHTTIDADLQKAAEDSLRKSLDQAEQHSGYDHQTYAEYTAAFKKAKAENKIVALPPPEYLQGAVLAVENESGGILALVGGRDFEHNQYDRALQAKRPAGTAMTPLVFAAAFEKGDYPGTPVEDSALDNRAVMIGGTTGILGEWGPESADNRYEGGMTARQALAKSKNGAAVRIGTDAGVENVLQLCKNAGIRSPLRPYPATFLGSSEITLMELTMAYTIFPNGGWRPSATHILEKIEEKDGTVWNARREFKREKVIKPEAAYEVHACLVEALESGTGKAGHAQFGLKKIPDAAGKTGTAYDFTDALFAGYDSAITCTVWAGFDKPQKIYRGAFGRELALPVWVEVMNASVAKYAPKEIAPPPTLKKAEICARSGLLATDKCYDSVKGATGESIQRRTTYLETGTAEQLPTEPCNVHGEPRARVARELSESEFPRAQSAVDLKEVPPVVVRSPALLADKDPYNSARPVLKATPAPTPETVERKIDNQPPPPNSQVIRALPLPPNDEPMEIRKAEPVGPLDEARDQLLRNTASPTPAEIDD
jgi:membrane carboxypeptidase/penicillin-binding protein